MATINGGPGGSSGAETPPAGSGERRGPRAALRWLARGSGTLVLALLLALVLFDNRRDILRHLLQVVLVWLPLLAVAHRRWLARNRARVALAAGSTCLCVLWLWLVGPTLVERVALRKVTLDVDHRPRPEPGRLNEDGVQPDMPASSYRESDYNIVFLGDSFTQGQAVSTPDTFPAQVETMLRQMHPHLPVRVVNFGWPSSSPVLQLRQLRAIGPRYKPDLVVQAFDMTDFHDDLKYAARLRREQGHALRPSIFELMHTALSLALGVMDLGAWLGERLVVQVPGSAQRRHPGGVPKRRFFAMLAPLDRTRPLLERSWQALLELDREARAMGARLVVFVLPRYQQYNRDESPRDWERTQMPPNDAHVLEPFAYFEEKAKDAPFPVYPLLDAFRKTDVFPTTWHDDPHYTPAGNRVAARAMARYLSESGVLPLSGKR